MSFDSKKLAIKIARTAAVAVVSALFSLIVLRSVYAISIFRALTSGMEQNGWVESDSVMQGGEDLTYEASYLFFKIGKVRMQILGKTVYDSIPAYHLRAYIDSYSGIPFVNLHAAYDTYQDARSLTCLFTSNTMKDGSDSSYTTCNFDFQRKVIDWERTENGKQVQQAQVPLDKEYTDGLSFFYYIRAASRVANGIKTSISIPIVVDTVRSKVDLTLNEEKEDCDVPAFDYPLTARKMSGHIFFTGFFGVTGNFTGWISADSAEVPLRGDVSVIIGSVVVKLKDAKRAGWIPPKWSD